LDKKKLIEAFINHQPADRIPWTIYQSYAPWGEKEYEYRKRGLTLVYQHFPIVKALYGNTEIEVSEESKYTTNKSNYKNIIVREFKTPLGKIAIQHEFIISSFPAPGDLIQKFGSEIDHETLSWISKYPVSEDKDYDAAEFIYKNIIYKPNFEDFETADNIIGSDGIIMANVGKSPFQVLLYELLGSEKCYLEYYSNHKKLMRLYEIIYEKQKEKYLIAAKSPAKLIWCPDNITSILTPPNFFKEFYLPFYNEMAEILHKNGKKYIVHMDGNLRSLIPLIKETDIDVIEAFTPPPMGDMPLEDTVKILNDKIIWINYPGNVIANYSSVEIGNYTLNLLKAAAPGSNFMIGCTEIFPIERWNIAFEKISEVLEKYGRYPIKI